MIGNLLQRVGWGVCKGIRPPKPGEEVGKEDPSVMAWGHLLWEVGSAFFSLFFFFFFCKITSNKERHGSYFPSAHALCTFSCPYLMSRPLALGSGGKRETDSTIFKEGKLLDVVN